jgi:hypothetical protein
VSALLRDRWFWLFVLLCAGGLALLLLQGADVGDALASLMLLGLVLPLLALTCYVWRGRTASVWRGANGDADRPGRFVAAVLMVKQPLPPRLLAATPFTLRETVNTLFARAVRRDPLRGAALATADAGGRRCRRRAGGCAVFVLVARGLGAAVADRHEFGRLPHAGGDGGC